MIKYQIWLQIALGAGNGRIKEILEKFGSAENVYKADTITRKEAKIFTPRELKAMEITPITDALKIIVQCEQNGINTVALGDENYPYCLSVIENPPLVLYVKGKMPDFDNTPSICIVGPRKVSEFGKKAAYSLGYRLARSGMVVVSGGALGTDTFAHAGALKGEGITVLVLGCGILSDYLPENKKLRDAVTENGCLISEYPPKASANKFTFPIRNRIMSALTLGTVVVEAGLKSGALITARHANEQGRDVFVIPASPDKKEYVGSNALLRDGAKPLLDVSDIFNEYIVRFPDKINIERSFDKPVIEEKTRNNNKNSNENEKILNESLSKEAKIVYNQLDRLKFMPEDIKNTGLNSNQLLSALGELEMEFLIKSLPGGMYEKL